MFTFEEAIQQRQYLLKQAEALKQQREAVLSQVSLLEKIYKIGKEKEDGPKTGSTISKSHTLAG